MGSSKDGSIIHGPAVLQITSVVNITQPTKRQGEDINPRLLQMKLTDGSMTVVAVEHKKLPDISTKTPPGAKLLLVNDIQIVNGKILLTPDNTKFIGGHVDHLYKAWQTNRQTYLRRSKGGGKVLSGGAANGDMPPSFDDLMNLHTSKKQSASAASSLSAQTSVATSTTVRNK